MNCLLTVIIVSSLSGVWPSGWRGGASPGQTVTEAKGSLRPRGWLHLCIRSSFRLPLPAASAVVGARSGHGRRHGRHRPSRTVEAGTREQSQCHEASSKTRNVIVAIIPYHCLTLSCLRGVKFPLYGADWHFKHGSWMLNVLMVTPNNVYIYLSKWTLCESILSKTWKERFLNIFND